MGVLRSLALGLLAILAVGSASAQNQQLCRWHDASNAVPTSAVLTGLDAVSDRDVWAVGWFSHSYTGPAIPVVLHWDGKAWKRVRTPLPIDQEPESVSGSSGKDVWIISSNGYDGRPTSIHWDGRSWRTLPIPTDPRSDPGRGSSNFSDVLALPDGEAWAVGTDRGQRGPDLPMLRRWDGKSWRVVAVPIPHGSTEAELDAVAGSSPRDVWVVGFSAVAHAVGPHQALALHWDGKKWQRIMLPRTQYIQSALDNVFAGGSSRAWATGSTDTNSDRGERGKRALFNVAWDGRRWQPFARGFTVAASAREGGAWALSPRHDVYRLRAGRSERVTRIPWAVRGQREVEAHLVETQAGTLWAYGGSFDARAQQERVHLAALRCR